MKYQKALGDPATKSGASGSIIPSYIYKGFGWNIMLTIFIFLIIIVALVVFFNRKLFKTL